MLSFVYVQCKNRIVLGQLYCFSPRLSSVQIVEWSPTEMSCTSPCWMMPQKWPPTNRRTASSTTDQWQGPVNNDNYYTYCNQSLSRDAQICSRCFHFSSSFHSASSRKVVTLTGVQRWTWQSLWTVSPQDPWIPPTSCTPQEQPDFPRSKPSQQEKNST